MLIKLSRKFLLFLVITSLSAISVKGQGSKGQNYLSNPIFVDSASTIIIPIKIESSMFSSAKLNLTDHYSNIIFYDLQSDSSKLLFKNDTYIRGYESEYRNNNTGRKERLGNESTQWLFYFVKSNDYNKNSKIDTDDPYILYVSDKKGNDLKSLTVNNENAVAIFIYDKQGYALIKMQRDLDKDADFDSDDTDYYYQRIDLNNLTLGNKIEIK